MDTGEIFEVFGDQRWLWKVIVEKRKFRTERSSL